jgi:hypothetical protein
MSPFCANCGANVDETWNNCPECGVNIKDQMISDGTEPSPSYQPSQPQTSYSSQQRVTQYSRSVSESNSYGIGALITAIIGLCCFSYVFGPIAIILGAMGRTRDLEPGMATAGLIIGIFDLCCGILSLILLPTLLQMLYYF